MSDFRPIDHKDSDAEYAGLIRGGVASKAGCDLLDTVDPAFLVGRWVSSIDYKHSDPFDFDFLDDGTYVMPISFAGPSPNTWRIDGDHFIQHSWCPPIPEYDIHEPMDDIETYRCAQLTDGRFAYWNGDGSLLVFLARTGG